MTPHWVVTCAMMVPAMVLAAWIDYRERRVPNWLNAEIAIAGFLLQAGMFGWQGLANGALGMLVGFACLILPWLMHGMGAGDVKLMMAVGVWLGPWWTLLSFCAGALIGGAMGLIMIVSSGRIWQAWLNLGTIVEKVSSRSTIFTEYGSAHSFGNSSQLLPYGVPLTLGTLLVLLYGPVTGQILF